MVVMGHYFVPYHLIYHSGSDSSYGSRTGTASI